MMLQQTSKLLLLVPLSLSFGQVHSTSFRPSEWGLADLRSIRLGEVSLIHDSNGPRLNIQALFAEGWFLDAGIRDAPGGCVSVTDFSHAGVNNLGGNYSVFQSPPSSASFFHPVLPIPTRTGKLQFVKRAQGYCGLWMHLFNSAAPPGERTYFDATGFASLHITMRGKLDAASLMLKVADSSWNEKEDAVPIGMMESFLPKGRIDTSWQTAVLPLSVLPRQLDRSRLATIVIDVTGIGTGEIEFGSVSFCSTPQSQSAVYESRPHTGTTEKALWVWNTHELINDTTALRQLTMFLRNENIDHVFLALPYDADHPDAPKGVPVEREILIPIVQELNESGHRVHALIGDKDFIRPEKQGFVQRTLENIVRYQASAPRSAQFYGVHLDIEPYLLPGFGSSRQEWFLRNLLRVLETSAVTVRGAGLVVGADIPPWLDSPNELTNTPPVVSWNGSTKPMYEHVIDLMDFVVLMNYRARMDGDDGLLFQALNELRYSDAVGKKVFIGLETVSLPDETLFRFRGRPGSGPIPSHVRDALIMTTKPDTMAILFGAGNRNEFNALLRTKNIDPADLLWWPIDRSSFVPSSRTSFATGGGLVAVRRIMEEAGRVFRNFPSFGGFSLHDYKGFVSLRDR